MRVQLQRLFVVALTLTLLVGCTSYQPVQGNIESYDLRKVKLAYPVCSVDIQPRRVMEDIDYNNRIIEKVKSEKTQRP